MNIKFGASLLSWITPIWTEEAGQYAIKKTAQAGFDLIEILLPIDMEIDAVAVKKQLSDNKIDVVCSLNLPKEAHIPFYPRGASELIFKALEKTAELESTFLGGVLHSGIGVFSGNPLTSAEKDIVVNVLGEAALYAEKLGITIGIEPINRYESYVCNTAANVLEVIEQTNAPNLAVHLDTFHMNIEENNFYDPIIAAGSKLKHIHITESHRGMLGEGNVNWDQFVDALKTINFDGNLVLENFSSSITGMQQAVSLWQPSLYNAQDLAVGSLHFIKEKIKNTI
ncbi:sugar phosphate isomerase/epimerase family protein [Flavobacterium hercynium]|uniref:Xylose isomerase n=1 Tax=Flavobacterium hercynium TaxID=387094 RepID=A0A226HAB8_9FLAO|nr:sugar phosphate isomerase/epimerase family protein [Flavobacterium hercynium]OXA90370.1 xylose isomerase [Flavobacterium hercynium]SMP25949.1 D-psicose/D-tagatose/L-ribulose 3-epimerase [Flavobacterium hercynium]